MQRLQIALVTETYPPEVNGVAMTLGRWVEGLTRRGHHVRIWRPDPLLPSTPQRNGHVREQRLTGFSLPMYPAVRFGLPSGRGLTMAWRTHRPDIVYIATEGPLGWSALRSARRLGVPIVCGFHTRFDLYSRHYRIGLLLPLIRRYLRHFHRKSTLTLVPTRQLQESLESGGFGRVAVVPRGVDTQLFNPSKRSAALREAWGLGEADIALLYVGRLAPEKNLETAVAAFRSLQRTQPSAQFILVGDGPDRPRLAKQPGLICAGERHGEELARYYASADLFVFPSRTETFGNVVLEAMASGLAIVAFDDAAAGIHIQHRESGLLAPLEDSARFDELVCEAAADRRLCTSIRQAARQHALSIGWDNVVDNLEALLHRCATSTRS